MGIFGLGKKKEIQVPDNINKSLNTKTGVFFLFVIDGSKGGQNSLGSSIGMMYGNLYGSGDLNVEAAKLKNQFSESDLEIEIVKNSEWSPVMTAKSVGGGMSTVSVDIESNKKRIEEYLRKKGYTNDQISESLKICTTKNLISTDYTSGRFFIGVPLI
jgi:hypothetical protein